MELLSGADMLVRSLQDEGVEYIYGYPGGSALHIYDAIFRQDKVKHILVRHEQAAAIWLTVMPVRPVNRVWSW